MDTRRICLLLHLLLLICIVNAITIQNGWSKPSNIRRVRKISEYLVPPPLPRFPPNRIPRVANFHATEKPGYFMRFMNWLNPFSSDSSQSPPPLQQEPLYPPKVVQTPLSPAATYNGPPPVIYEKPPLPPSLNDQSAYPTSIKARSCNSCNKVPWMPMQHADSGDHASYVPPPQALVSNDGYVSETQQVPYDAYHAASQEIRVPDYAFNAPLPSDKPVPNPFHLYPGAMPPLFDASNFSEQFVLNENYNKLPTSVSGNSVSTGPSGGEISQKPYTPPISDYPVSGTLNNEEHYDVTGSSGNSDLNWESNYNNHKNNYLPTTTNAAENPLESVSNLDLSIGLFKDSNFEIAPVIDFTSKNENWTHTSSVPSNSNAFTDSKRDEITTEPSDRYFKTRPSIASTESYLPTNFKTTTAAVRYNIAPDEDDVWIDDYSPEREPKKQVQVIIPYTSQHTPLPFKPQSFHERKISNTNESNYRDDYVGEASNVRTEVVRPPNSSHVQSQTTVAMSESTTNKSFRKDNVIDGFRLQKNIDNWTIQAYSQATTVSTERASTPSASNKPYLSGSSKQIPNEYLTTTDVTNSHNSKTFTLGGFSFIDQEYKDSTSNHKEGPRIKVKEIEKSSTENPTGAPIVPTENTWQKFPLGISSVNKEFVYIVTPEPIVSTPRSNTEYRKLKALKDAERNKKESKEISQTDIKKTEKSDTFDSIEKAYQVLPQAVNNLAVASTGPESVSLWSIMEHEEFASPADEYDNNDTESPTLYSKLSKESRAKR
ncbi:uncharacterized protein LOC105193724 [Solenopsis invicta]|uniref:uncharacterized protein LOC105193724 n=1 Tax=Solenopsis invicta TaxID=13686 RepID=UPI00193DEB6B|nr:uncharacterized protein LOC105193724 [Solenopsis invicta]